MTYTWVEAESRDVRRSPTSYAADWEVLRTKAGRYPVTFTTIDGRPCAQADAYWVTVSVDAERIDGKFYSGFGGLNFASSLAKLGPAPLPIQLYAYQLDRMLADGSVVEDDCDHRFWTRQPDGKRRCVIVGCGALLPDGYFAPAPQYEEED